MRLIPSVDQYIDAYKKMFRARATDEKAIVLYKQNKCHFQIGCAGHEAVQVAAAHNLIAGDDWVYPYYRDMAFCMTLGLTSREVLLGCLNKADGPSSGGRQMPMHYGHKSLNIVSQSSPTGTQFLQAVGAAVGVKHRDSGKVVYVSAGEGTTAQGAFHEAMNWAARDQLPIVFLIQNNQYAISVHISEQIAGGNLASIASGYEGMNVEQVDGLNYTESYAALSSCIKRARDARGPSIVLADVVRLQSHSISDNQFKYRTEEAILRDQQKDPLTIHARHIVENGILKLEELKQVESEILDEVNSDSEWAEAQADPVAESFSERVYVMPDMSLSFLEPKVDAGEEVFMVDAINHALDEELAVNSEMLVYGQDVAGGKGGVFSATKGLTDKYGPQKVFNSQLAEASICGAGVGLATIGMTPVAEIQFGDYIWTGMMQIRNELAMMQYRSNGSFSCPLVIRVAVGGYIRGALYHSQSIEATFSHLPGIYVVMPSNATDAKGLLKSAIRSPNPVLFLEHKGLYRQVFAKGLEGGVDDCTPIGKAKIVRPGEDATIVTWGMLVHFSQRVAEKFAKRGISIEVIDLRTINPLDTESILESVRKTGRLLIAHEDIEFMGFGAEIAAIVGEKGFEFLDAPIIRVAGKNTPIPHAPVLEREVLPQESDIETGLNRLLAF